MRTRRGIQRDVFGLQAVGQHDGIEEELWEKSKCLSFPCVPCRPSLPKAGFSLTVINFFLLRGTKAEEV